MGEKAVVDLSGTIVKWVDKWEPVDPGACAIGIYHNAQDDRFRLVARTPAKQVVINNWVKKDLQFTKLSDTFCNLNLGGVNYGINFNTAQETTDFLSSLENCVEILKLKEGIGSLSPLRQRVVSPGPQRPGNEGGSNPKSLIKSASSPVLTGFEGQSRQGVISPGPRRPSTQLDDQQQQQQQQSSSSQNTLRSSSVLQMPDGMPIPRPIAIGPNSVVSDPTVTRPAPSPSLPSPPPLEEKLAEKKAMRRAPRSLKHQAIRLQTISAKDLTKKYQSLRLKNKDVSQVSGGTSNSLTTIATTFEEESLSLIRSANTCMLNPSVPATTMSLGKVKEMFEMIMILTKRPQFSGILHQSIDGVIETIQRTANHGKVDSNTVEAATGLAVQLVKASLVKKIFTSLLAVRNFSIQMKCILKFIANIDLDHVALVQLISSIKSFLSHATQLNNDVATYKQLDALDIQKLSSSSEENRNENPIWSEATSVESLEQNKGEIRLGNLNQLILKLTSDTTYDNKYLKTFIITYQSFTTPWLLFEKLKQRFQVPSNVPEKTKNLIQLRVTIVLKHWAETQIDDFDDAILRQLQQFLSQLTSQENLKNVATALENYIVEKIHERGLQTQLMFTEPEKVEVPEEGICLSDLFLELPTQMIAEQLTIIDFEIFKTIEPTELLDQSWNKQKLKHRSPNVLAMIARSTNVSLWVATMILSQENINFRVRMFEKMIDIAKHLEKLQNFNTLMGVIAGLNLSAIHRLKTTKKKVVSGKLDQFKKTEKLMDPEGSFKNYRKQISSFPPPSLPYLGVHLSDLTFIEEGNPNMIDGLINFKKRDMLVETIRQIQQYQSTPYDLEIVEPIYTFLSELPGIEEKELYNLSVALEKKVAKN